MVSLADHPRTALNCIGECSFSRRFGQSSLAMSPFYLLSSPVERLETAWSSPLPYIRSQHAGFLATEVSGIQASRFNFSLFRMGETTHSLRAVHRQTLGWTWPASWTPPNPRFTPAIHLEATLKRLQWAVNAGQDFWDLTLILLCLHFAAFTLPPPPMLEPPSPGFYDALSLFSPASATSVSCSVLSPAPVLLPPLCTPLTAGVFGFLPVPSRISQVLRDHHLPRFLLNPEVIFKY